MTYLRGKLISYILLYSVFVTARPAIPAVF